MNKKLLLKILLVIAILLLLVMMGKNNPQLVELKMPPLLPKAQKLPAAFMYFAFFAVGVLSGALLTAGSKGGGGSRAKSDK